MYEFAADIARVANVVLLTGLLFLMRSRANKTAGEWTGKALGIFRFMFLVCILLWAGSLERFVADGPPNPIILVFPFVIAYGITQFMKPERLNK